MIALFAVMIVVLVGSAAFAIDIAYWHFEQTHEQRAADAAALAGAVTYPADAANSNAQAIAIAMSNGYTVPGASAFDADGHCHLPAGATNRICTGPGKQPYQFKVTVVRKVKNLFGGIFGIGTATIAASATGEYLKPLSMGSPSNQFGNDPDNTSWPLPNPPPLTYPNFWGNIEGAGTAKQQGDAFAANWCDNTVTDGCNGTGDGQNLDYKGGYYYTVDFTAGATTNLQAFDPAFVHVGQFCNDGSANLSAASNLGNIPSYPEGPTNTADIKKRFAPVGNSTDPKDPGFQYCTGDQSFSNSRGANVAPATTYQVLKATVPGEPGSAVAVPGCNPITYPGFTGDVSTPLRNGTTPPGAPARFATYFRQWVTLCQVTGQTGDEYFIHVTTDNGGGSNHFALRGVQGAFPSKTPAPVTIAGNSYMGLYANVGGNQQTNFYLARLPSAAHGHTLILNLYDIGDADSVGSLKINAPPDSNINFGGNTCKWTGNLATGALGYAPNTPKQPWGPLNSINNCQITNVNGGGTWNGQWSTVQIPIPANYTCKDADPQGCWITITYLFAGAVHDVTSWNASLLGDPVRLVQ